MSLWPRLWSSPIGTKCRITIATAFYGGTIPSLHVHHVQWWQLPLWPKLSGKAPVYNYVNLWMQFKKKIPIKDEKVVHGYTSYFYEQTSKLKDIVYIKADEAAKVSNFSSSIV